MFSKCCFNPHDTEHVNCMNMAAGSVLAARAPSPGSTASPASASTFSRFSFRSGLLSLVPPLPVFQPESPRSCGRQPEGSGEGWWSGGGACPALP